jgi:hypothetical protein
MPIIAIMIAKRFITDCSTSFEGAASDSVVSIYRIVIVFYFPCSPMQKPINSFSFLISIMPIQMHLSMI